ncbi:uncharacterized protein TA11060 [Theileria annulata]|uniref:RING-type E3 ubiquitin transferase n=1 Tax=Theileria annulata TaxID=5874 RepID=Q4U8G2_THEAN|nr:uncharacterized protein TA11060 [Theileria annulata]CAI76891.1 hypothetical protein, conserved [Theileria annulata]|eukprot:XP_953516.1 hypothetical protein, conserved [Theileria annulata]
MEGQQTENVHKKPEESANSKFECNICFDDVKDPVVTRCGHLFCWSCLLSWMNRRNYQCPICQAGISRDNVIPLYGHGQNQSDPRDKPEEPRPKAQRSTNNQRQNSFFRGYENRISVSFGSFPFSFIFPIAFGTSNTGSFFDLFRNDESSSNMTSEIFVKICSEQRRAYAYTGFLSLIGLLMIAYLILCI